jgi:hypothetical protein
MSGDSRLAFIVVLHLSPQNEKQFSGIAAEIDTEQLPRTVLSVSAPLEAQMIQFAFTTGLKLSAAYEAFFTESPNFVQRDTAQIVQIVIPIDAGSSNRLICFTE